MTEKFPFSWEDIGKKAEYLGKKISSENNLLSWWGAIDVAAV